MRELLISRLTVCINEREGAELTDEQVDNYIGSDMGDYELFTWLEDAESGEEPITVEDVMALWDM